MATVIEAEKLIIRGSGGKARGEFGMSGDTCSLRLNDDAEKCRAEINVGADGSPDEPCGAQTAVTARTFTSMTTSEA